MLRGRDIKYVDYIAVGKGRDMSMETICMFEAKVMHWYRPICPYLCYSVSLIAAHLHRLTQESCVMQLLPAVAPSATA